MTIEKKHNHFVDKVERTDNVSLEEKNIYKRNRRPSDVEVRMARRVGGSGDHGDEHAVGPGVPGGLLLPLARRPAAGDTQGPAGPQARCTNVSTQL